LTHFDGHIAALVWGISLDEQSEPPVNRSFRYYPVSFYRQFSEVHE